MPLDSTNQTRWFTEQVQPHEIHLRRWLEARFPSLGDRDDLVQESFARALRSHAIAPILNVRGFLFTTARNLALNQLRRRLHEHPKGMGEIDPSRVLDENVDTPESVARRQELEFLQLALQSLPARCREVFTLRRINGLSQKEIAARLGISEKTVENHNVTALARCVEYFRRVEAGTINANTSVAPSPGEFSPSRMEVRHA